ncbi:MAG: hypothetical protein WBE35_01600 [Candidatus Cybelea sp.]
MLASYFKNLVAAVTVIALLTGCAGGQSTATTPALLNRSDKVKRAMSGCPCLYVTNTYPTNSITVYGADATGDASPLRTISGPNTGLDDPSTCPKSAFPERYRHATRH